MVGDKGGVWDRVVKVGGLKECGDSVDGSDKGDERGRYGGRVGVGEDILDGVENVWGDWDRGGFCGVG